MQRQEFVSQKAAVHLRRPDMAPLMCGCIKGNMMGGGNGAAHHFAHVENGHIAVFPIPGRNGCTYTGKGLFGLFHHVFHLLGKLSYMRKHGLALAKAAFTRFDGQQAPALHDLSLGCAKGS